MTFTTQYGFLLLLYVFEIVHNIMLKKRKKKDTCTAMFIAALFTTAKTWKQPKCPSTYEWIKKMWYIYTMKYYSFKKNEILPFSTTWMDVEGIILSEVSQTKKDKYRMTTLVGGIEKIQQGLPSWCNGWGSASQYRGHGFKAWSGEILHAAEQLSPCATTTELRSRGREPQLLKPARLERVLQNKRSHRN